MSVMQEIQNTRSELMLKVDTAFAELMRILITRIPAAVDYDYSDISVATRIVNR